MRKYLEFLILWLFLVVIIASCGGVSSSPNGGASSDTIAPYAPTGLIVTAVSSSAISLNWNASTDNIGVIGYKIFRNGTQISTTTSTAINDTGLISSTTYTYTVSAYDVAENNSPQSTPLSATTSSSEPLDTLAPMSPANLAATAVGSSQINLTWSSSQDNVNVAGYKIYRDGAYLKSVTTTTTGDTGLSESTAYCYFVAAFDAANNASEMSAQVCATTTTSATIGVAGSIYWNWVPVPNAVARIKTGSDYYSGTTVAETITNASGAFHLGDVPAGDYYIYAIKPEGSTEYWDWTGRPVTVRANELVNVGTMRLSKIMTLIEPQNSGIVTTNPPTFSWQAVPDADSYSLAVFERGASTRTVSVWFTGTSYTPTEALPSGREYVWFVHAYNYGIQIAYYSEWNFTIP